MAMDRYVVIGNPVAHSLSPAIHARFAEQCSEQLEYGALLAPLADFRGAARDFFASGGRGANVTLPFKVEASRFADELSDRSRLAGASNVLIAERDAIRGDNTDGIGLVADLTRNLGLALRSRRILMIGAGGAARGVIAPLLELEPALLLIANRKPERSRELAERFRHLGPIAHCGFDAMGGEPFDLVINATSASTHGEPLEIPEWPFAPAAMAYDMAYGAGARPFLERCASRGMRTSDGWGMLVEQAAESFALWRGRRPDTAAVLATQPTGR